MKSKYWSNIFGMLGVALVATAFFQKMPDNFLGFVVGLISMVIGSTFKEN